MEIPTEWFETIQISTWVGESLTTEGKEPHELSGGHAKLLVLHQCGDDKESLIGQLRTMIYGLENGLNEFAQ